MNDEKDPALDLTPLENMIRKSEIVIFMLTLLKKLKIEN
jgi:hypothetical protein